MSKEWHTPKAQEVNVQEDSTSMGCQGKAIGCYAGSSCGSVVADKQQNSDKKK